MAGMGPPPNPNARHRAGGKGRGVGVELPASGYDGPVPDWPLPPDAGKRALLDTMRERLARVRDDWTAATGPSAARKLGSELDKLTEQVAALEAYLSTCEGDELALWAQLWRTPMAAQWARLGWAREVALYVRLQLEAESGDQKAAAEARQRGDRLGLTPLSLLRLQWRIGDEPAAAAVPEGDDLDNVRDLFGT